MTPVWPTVTQWVLLCAAGAAAGTDGSAGPHAMLARPLVAGAAGGAVLGDPAAGLLAGALLELMTLPYPAMGAARTPDTGVAGVVGGAAYAAAGGLAGLGAAVLAGWGAGWAGEWSRRWLRRLNGRLLGGPAELDGGDPGALESRQRTAALLDVARAGAVTAALAVPSALAASATARAAGAWGWTAVAGVAVGLGAAAGSSARVLSTGRYRPALGLSALLGGVALGAFLLP